MVMVEKLSNVRLASRRLVNAAVCLIAVAALVLPGTPVAAWPPCDDFIWAEVENSTVTIHHDGALYNCCTDGFDYAVSQQGAVIQVVETEILTNPCYCVCCMDNFVIIEGIAPGEYTVLFTWYDYETDDWLEWPLEIFVPDVGQGGSATLARSGSSGCYDPTTAQGGGTESATWGRVKARYHE
jgi:hypothetical protein